MPYIKQDRRTVFEDAIQDVVDKLGQTNGMRLKEPKLGELGKTQNVDGIDCSVQDIEFVHDDDAAKGELNYVIYSIIKRYLEKHGMRYARAQDFIGGVLTCCQLELYRRLLGPYEDSAIIKNSDV